MRRSVRQFKEENVGRRGASGISGNGTASTRLSNARKRRGAASVDVDGVANVEIAKIGVRRRAISGKNTSALNFVSSDRKRLRIKSRKPETPRGASVAFQRFERRVDDKRTPCRLDPNGKSCESDKSAIARAAKERRTKEVGADFTRTNVRRAARQVSFSLNWNRGGKTKRKKVELSRKIARRSLGDESTSCESESEKRKRFRGTDTASLEGVGLNACVVKI